MNIVSVSRNHDASVAVLSEGYLSVHTQEERHSKQKHDGVPFWSLMPLDPLVKSIDRLCISATSAPDHIQEPKHLRGTYYDITIGKIFKQRPNWTTHYFHDFHHLTHAANAFYASGFNEAVCVVFDGGGSFFNFDYYGRDIEGRERHSVFTAEYPNKFECAYREINAFADIPSTKLLINNIPNYVTKHPESFGFIFNDASKAVGLKIDDAGKLMGMAAYGKDDLRIPSVYRGREYNPNFCSQETVDFLSSSDFSTKANFAYKVQKEVQERAIELILKAVHETKARNVCISGGYALNCTANYEYLKHLPAGVKLYVDPVAHDAGISVGAAKYLWHNLTKDTTVRPLTSLYLGYETEMSLPKDVESQKVSYEDVAKLISNGNIVAIFQGKSEAGPRALGNRSILFDPRNPNGKEIVNTVKGREWFRPFAGTVLKEKANDWFEMRGLEESPFMTYAVQTKEAQKSLIPSIVHVDGSCRIQTVTKQQNMHFYNLIQKFEALTGVPILFNTSFNLAGDPMVETVEDALSTLYRSKLDYVYFPELNCIVKNKRLKNENSN